jgi:hypothetical protein
MTGRTAYEKMKKYMKPFGLLAYVKYQPVGQLTKLEPRWSRMVFLGFNPHTPGWLFGWWVRTKGSGHRWMTTTSRSAKFTNLRVKNLEWVSYNADDDFLDCSPQDECYLESSDTSIWEPGLVEDLGLDSNLNLHDQDPNTEHSHQELETSFGQQKQRERTTPPRIPYQKKFWRQKL